jgi:ectoine hydroxylase-related dioxygenase (phytanoyl-CoA dioxygenase family)
MAEMELDRLAASFEERGFVVLPGALDKEQVAHLNRAIDLDIGTHGQEWAHFGESFIQTVVLLPRTSEFDFAIENPKVLALLSRLMGQDISFEELSIIIRNPTEEQSDHKSWHRDIVRDYERRFEINAISVVYYVTDVTETDHCFSIIPGTHGPRAAMRPEEVERGMEVDLMGAAGSAILFHARCLHSGKLKPESRQRRTLHLYYSLASLPRTSEWSSIPERLYGKTDTEIPATLYSKWNREDVVIGTGVKPRGLEPGLPVVELLREAQRRAKA